MTQMSGNYIGRVPNDSNVYVPNSSGNLNSHVGKANYQSIWQRIQIEDANVSSCDMKNWELSQVDDVVIAKKTDTNQEMHKVLKDLRRNKDPGSPQEHKGKPGKGCPSSGACLSYMVQSNGAVGAAGQVSVIRGPGKGKNLEDIKALPGVTQFKDLRNCSTCAVEDCKSAAASDLFPGDKSRTFCDLRINLRNIRWAVNEAHRAQIASEAIAEGTGYPVAEFEKLLHSASPVICPSVDVQTCQACFHGQGTPLCRHKIPNISLGNLWHWYEKHGSYGLEVKAEDNRTSKRYGIDSIKFRAYFVPFLSAVQLFKYHRAHPGYNDNGMNKVSECSPLMVDLRSIFSVLVPQPRIEGSSSLPERNVVSHSISSSKCSDTDLPVDSKLSDDNLELLFEYFESGQPQSRKPLFEKIQELVAGYGHSSCEVYGDPSILQSARLSDLHPHSWFSVAWYPIYQIPDGNLRAAFLTYHSLGHYVGRNQTLDAPSLKACVISPVVGLQSYNAQGECWFQPRHPADHLKDVPSASDPSSVLRDRLRTLEQTASLMSRAVRTDGEKELVNRHPDYEFFLSRRT